MIPDTVELTDFLSHRCADGEPVVFDFDGAVLWSVSGDNGAGKSAIFDAITWTLFNEHRGGSQDAKRLISHGADRCRAAFTFTLGGERYRVERSLRRRGSAKRSAARWDAVQDAWQEIPETSSERGFEHWRDEILGLSFAAFTQSVLLLQGDSDRLIRAGSRERFEILAQLVDLSSYKALEDLARERASEARGHKGALRKELEGMSAVDADERKAANAEAKRLSRERERREQARRAQVAVVAGATDHERLQQRLAAIGSEIEGAEKLLAKDDVETIERAAQTARDDAATTKAAAEDASRHANRLARALPAIETAVLRRCELADVEAGLAQIGESAAATRALAACDETIEKLKAGLGEARDVERDVTRRLSVLESDAARLEREVAGIRAGEAEAVCSRCGQEVPAGQREAADGEMLQKCSG